MLTSEHDLFSNCTSSGILVFCLSIKKNGTMKNFMLFLHEAADSNSQLSPEDMGALVKQSSPLL